MQSGNPGWLANVKPVSESRGRFDVRWHRPRFLTLLLVLLSALVLAACGSSSQDAPSTTQPPPTATTTSAPTTTSETAAEMVGLKYGDAVDVSGFDHLSGRGSLVANAWFDAQFEYLVVQLGSDSYEYCGVPAKVWSEFTSAESLGTFYNRVLKGNYDCQSGTTSTDGREPDSTETAASTFDDVYLGERAAIIGAHTRDRLMQVNESEDPSELHILSLVIASNSRQMQIVADLTEDPNLYEAIVLYSEATLEWSEAVNFKSQWAETGQDKFLDSTDMSIESALEMQNTAVRLMDDWADKAAPANSSDGQDGYTDAYLAAEAITIGNYSSALLHVAEESDDEVEVQDVGSMLADNANRLGRLAEVVEGNRELADAIRQLSGGWQQWSDAMYSWASWLETDDDEWIEFFDSFSTKGDELVEDANDTLSRMASVGS